MKDKRFVLNLHLEQNEELMAEIDALIRERVKMIIREEAEKMIGGTVQEEAQRVVRAKLDAMRNYQVEAAIASGVRKIICWNDRVDGIFKNEVKAYLKDREQMTNQAIKTYVNTMLSDVVHTDIIKAVVNAITRK